MNIFLISFDANGQITGSISLPDDHADLYPDHIVSSERVSPTTHYVENGAVVAFPAKPSPYHVWDWAAKQWVPDLPGAIAALKSRVNEERIRRNCLPIDYNGITIDADQISQGNVADWQIQLASGATLPDGFVWRDTNNVDHPADAAFVNGLGAALTLRGTKLYASAWQHKANIDALTTIDAVLAYDITQNWNA